ncbi:Uncharacterized protein Fot_34830 [Forsythia ovata]|uniref:Uncharacterized protein n=1 Tax=Forsythia ovata TaxID=205694 RepID=A0ABD1SJT6_9LAMI
MGKSNKGILTSFPLISIIFDHKNSPTDEEAPKTYQEIALSSRKDLENKQEIQSFAKREENLRGWMNYIKPLLKFPTLNPVIETTLNYQKIEQPPKYQQQHPPKQGRNTNKMKENGLKPPEDYEKDPRFK